jgi:ankyrin repeat protein
MLPASGLVEVDQTCIYGTALHLAAYAGNKDALRLLLNYGANVTIFL